MELSKEIEAKKNYGFLVILIMLFVLPIWMFLIKDPWWTYLIPTLILGRISRRWNFRISKFILGFVVGLIIWGGTTFYFSVSYEGDVFTPLSAMLDVEAIVIWLVICFVGGLTTGLAFYTGSLIGVLKR